MWPALGTYPVGTVAGGAVGESRVRLPLQVEVTSSAVRIRLPLRVDIRASARIRLPLQVEVLDAEVLGGLDGAAGWAAAPSGRWCAVVVLDGQDISERLRGDVIVRQARNEASTAEFSWVPAANVEPLALIGRPVQIAFAQRTASGAVLNAQTMFTGVVESPSVDLQNHLIGISAHDQLQEILRGTPAAAIDALVGGRWHVAVSGEAADNWEYATARLASVPADLALNAYQQPALLPWRGLSRELTVRDGDYVDGTLSTTYPSRSELRTRIEVTLQYRYPRLRGRGIVASYSQPIRWFIGDKRGTADEPSKLWLTTAMVQGAAGELSGWTLRGELAINNPAPGTYLMGDTLEEGFYTIRGSVAPSLALGFQAHYTSRWQQTVTETWACTVINEALEAQLGTQVPEEAGATLEAEFEVEGWEDDPAVEPALSIPLVGDVINRWQPAGANDAARDEVLFTLLDRAWVQLWGSSRSGRVSASLPLRPDLWLDTWMRFETDSLRSAGPVQQLEHTMSTEGGTAVTQFSIAVGLPGNADQPMPAWLPPETTLPEEDPGVAAFSCEIGTYVGGTAESPAFDEETMVGFVTNIETNLENPAYNWYGHQLSLRTPDVAADYRDALELEEAVEYKVAIPTDLLEVSL